MKKGYLYSGVLVVLIIFLLFNFFNTPLVEQSKLISLQDGDVFNLDASYVTNKIDGIGYKMLAYNGSIPGPTIEVEQGSEITINFLNNTDMPQLLHSHGIRMENAFDGTQLVQKEVQPGEKFEYKLKFLDPGIYWYHPHAGEVYGQALGLYGAFIVRPKETEYFPPVNKEAVIFLSDLLVKDGEIIINRNEEGGVLMGHYGNKLLVNGKVDYYLNVYKGEVVRFYLVNSANTRPFNFVVDGAKMKLVGGDSGAYEKAKYVDNVIISPSERVIVDVLFDEVRNINLLNKTPEKTYVLGEVKVSEKKIEDNYKTEFNTLQSNQDTISTINPFRKYFFKTPDKNITLSVDMMGGMNDRMMYDDVKELVDLMGITMTKKQALEHCQIMPSMAGCEPYLNNEKKVEKDDSYIGTDNIEWEDNMNMMNQMSTKKMIQWKIVDDDTNKTNMDIMWNLKKNDPVKIRIFNDPKSTHPMQHPIHFHGQRFLVVSRNGVLQDDLVWKDTALIRVGETVDIILDPSNIGNWMAHCHISEHLNNGMMFGFRVE